MGWAGIGGNGMARVGLNCLLSTQNAKEQDEFSCFFFFLLLMGFFKKIFWLFFLNICNLLIICDLIGTIWAEKTLTPFYPKSAYKINNH